MPFAELVEFQSSEHCKPGDLDTSELGLSVERLCLLSTMGWGPEELGNGAS